MLSINWRRLATLAAVVVVASALTNGALAAGSPVPANLKQQISQIANSCRAAFAHDKKTIGYTVSCDLLGVKKYDDYFHSKVSAAQWKVVLELNARSISLCNKLRPTASVGKLKLHPITWAGTFNRMQCWWGGRDGHPHAGVDIMLATGGHPLPVAAPCTEQDCVTVGQVTMSDWTDRDGCNTGGIGRGDWCHTWAVSTDQMMLQITSWSASAFNFPQHRDDYERMKDNIASVLGLLPSGG